MEPYRIHVFGASGSGTSTLGSVLAARLSVQYFDADNYYWQPTEPPYTLKNPPEKRVERLLKDMAEAKNWVLSGSVVSWGDAFIPLFSLAIFVTLPQEIRMQRLSRRERQRYGSRIDIGGDRHEANKAFLNWAALYDIAGSQTRSKTMHEQWIKRLQCRVIRVESLKSPETIATRVLEQIAT